MVNANIQRRLDLRNLMTCPRSPFAYALSILVFAAILALPATGAAQAEQAIFDYQLKNKAQTDQGAPVLILRAREFVKSGTVTMNRSDGKTQTTKLGSMKPAQEKRVPFRTEKGEFKYTVTVEGTTQFDQTTSMNFETTVAYVDPIKLDVDRERVEIGEGRLVLNSNVPLDKVEIEIFDTDGSKIVSRVQPIGSKSGDIQLTWPSKTSEVGAIRLKAHDVAGFWAGVVLEPFWVEIPHEDVVFDFGKSTWQPEEEPKLEKTLKSVQEALKKHQRKGLSMSMYIAGYTDTVGSAAQNQKLSRERARAIGAWFKKKNLNIDVYVQGFGESALAVQTPDNTPEPRNRRAIYILGNAPPPTSGQIPKSNWRKL